MSVRIVFSNNSASLPTRVSGGVAGLWGRLLGGAGREQGWRCGGRRVEVESTEVARAWVVAVGVVFVMVGAVGLMRPISGVGWVEPAEAGLAEVLAEAEEAADGVMVESVERPWMGEELVTPAVPVAAKMIESQEVIDITEVAPDVPLVVEVLDADELLAVPPAAAVEAMVEPLVRARAEPRVNPAAPRRAAAVAAGVAATAEPAAATAGPTAGAAGRPGGVGVARLPAPPYPLFARSRGLQGTTFLNITVSASGSVAKAEVVGSSGYSELDRYAAGWVQKRWRWPAGELRIFRQPVVFRLR